MNVVVIDTNVFVRHTHLCRKQQGPALIGLLRSTAGKIFLPEILRNEYFEQTQAMVVESFAEMQKQLGILKSVIGMQVLTAPSQEAIGQLVQQRLEQLSPITLEGPSVDGLMMAAGRRSVAKLAPTTKTDHGLKDCIIWEAVLTLLPGTKVWLATNDNGFFKDKTDELHPDLRADAAARGIDIEISRTLEPIIKAITLDFPDVNVAELEQRELQEQGYAADSSAPPAPVSSDSSGTDGDIASVRAALAANELHFDELELKVLGYISYLDPVPKTELFDALRGAGISIEMSSNVAGRLALKGLIRDTGKHYLIDDRSIQNAAAATVEKEMIGWLASKRQSHE